MGQWHADGADGQWFSQEQDLRIWLLLLHSRYSFRFWRAIPKTRCKERNSYLPKISLPNLIQPQNSARTVFFSTYQRKGLRRAGREVAAHHLPQTREGFDNSGLSNSPHRGPNTPAPFFRTLIHTFSIKSGCFLHLHPSPKVTRPARPSLQGAPAP